MKGDLEPRRATVAASGRQISAEATEAAVESFGAGRGSCRCASFCCAWPDAREWRPLSRFCLSEMDKNAVNNRHVDATRQQDTNS